MNGVSSATFFYLPMLGKHPDEYPRFRACFLSDYDDYIHVLTRTGGGNRKRYVDENDAIQAMAEYVTDWDEPIDCTYASWIFQVPEKWKPDFDALRSGNLKAVSKEYQDQMKKVLPELADKVDELFSA